MKCTSFYEHFLPIRMAQKWRFTTKFLKLSLIAQRRTWITDYQYSEDIESGRSIDTTKSGNICVQHDQGMSHGQTRECGKSQDHGLRNVNQPPASSSG